MLIQKKKKEKRQNKNKKKNLKRKKQKNKQKKSYKKNIYKILTGFGLKSLVILFIIVSFIDVLK
jgi:hypothetical protein